MRQQTRIPIANGFRNLRIQKQEKHHMRKTPTEEETVALGTSGSEGGPDMSQTGDVGNGMYIHYLNNHWKLNVSDRNTSEDIEYQCAQNQLFENRGGNGPSTTSKSEGSGSGPNCSPTICQGKCVDVCNMGYHANNPMSRSCSSPCIRGSDERYNTYNPKSSPTWQSKQIGNLATWYYRNDGYFFDKWNSDSSPPTSCFCTAPKALSTSSSGSILAKA